MSLAELLPSIRALPRAEQVRLMHLLLDAVAVLPTPAPPIPPGLVAELWSPTTHPADARAWAAVEAALAEVQKGAR